MPEAEKLIHEILPVGMLQCNCHILGDPKTREAIVIDPGDDAARILQVIERHHLKVVAIVVTHTHIDHVVGLHRVHQATGAPVYVHGDDLDLYRMLDAQALWLGWKTPEQISIDQLVREGDLIRWGGYQAQILHTPGHTPGSICLYMPGDLPSASTEDGGTTVSETGNGRLFAGDTLFAGSIGRTDLWGGSFAGIIRSLKGKLLELPDNTIVFPGHGESTTIGEERATNPFLAGNRVR
jgi:glyoxylase-like metal-dependent hydrolase (beta-lactamase superfamily II)